MVFFLSNKIVCEFNFFTIEQMTLTYCLKQKTDLIKVYILKVFFSLYLLHFIYVYCSPTHLDLRFLLV